MLGYNELKKRKATKPFNLDIKETQVQLNNNLS